MSAVLKEYAGDISYRYWKDTPANNAVADLLSQDFDISPAEIQGQLHNILSANNDFGAGIFETDRYIVAWVDHIRTWPVFYAIQNEQFYVSPSAEEVRKAAELTQKDPASVTEFSMSGYVTGAHTLYKGLCALLPGECIVWDKKARTHEIIRYYRYLPTPEVKAKWDIETLDQIMDRLTLDMIKRAGGKTIWVPLSAGLDSRLLLCKLHEHGYENLKTFSYGPRMNFELLHAKRIAKTLGVPWQHVAPAPWTIRRYFEDEARERYWNYASQYKTIPSMREYSALAWMHEKGIAKEGDVFINGQSGDYITGGHIHKDFLEPGKTNLDGFFERVIGKHFSCWESLLTDKNKAILKARIRDAVGDDLLQGNANIDRARQEEMWEYDARQICLVANGQRSYEFFGYEWEMPLWAKPLCDFCETLSLEEKKEQALYKRYLQDYNYMGLFPAEEPHLWRWPVYMLWVVPTAKLIELIRGQEAKQNFYALMRYFGHYANQYAFVPFSEHKETYKDARNVMSLYIRKWLSSNGVNFNSLKGEQDVG